MRKRGRPAKLTPEQWRQAQNLSLHPHVRRILRDRAEAEGVSISTMAEEALRQQFGIHSLDTAQT